MTLMEPGQVTCTVNLLLMSVNAFFKRRLMSSSECSSGFQSNTNCIVSHVRELMSVDSLLLSKKSRGILEQN